MDSKESDERFSHMLKDPRFRTIPKSDKKVKIDKRFKTMFTGKQFKLKYSMDKRGRPIKQTTSEDLNKFYDLSDNEYDEDDEDDDEKGEKSGVKFVKPKVPDARGNDMTDDDDTSSSSSSDDDDDDDDSEDEEDESEEEIDHRWGELDKNVTEANDITKRFAVCNLDWDRIKAVDLFVLMNSFKPTGSSIISVKIYPSQFGLERMKVEEERGPIELVSESDKQIVEEEIQENDEEDYVTPKITEKLRQYQMNRLKYFYAVVECDTPETANALYNELDGMEYESSSSLLDLRFIPDQMTFEETPKCECYSLPDATSYKPPLFITTALQQSKVRLTWDETDHERKERLQRAFKNLNKDDDDLQVYLASSSEDDDDEGIELENQLNQVESKDKINKYKELLNSLDKNEEEEEGNMKMEITWDPDLEEKTEKLIERKEKEKELTQFETDYLKKKESRKTNRKGTQQEYNEKINRLNNSQDKQKISNASNEEDNANLELLLMDNADDSNKKHFNYKKLIEEEKTSKKSKKLKQKRKNDDFKVSLRIYIDYFN